jgi:hypothetical protein
MDLAPPVRPGSEAIEMVAASDAAHPLEDLDDACMDEAPRRHAPRVALGVALGAAALLAAAVLFFRPCQPAPAPPPAARVLPR